MIDLNEKWDHSLKVQFDVPEGDRTRQEYKVINVDV